MRGDTAIAVTLLRVLTFSMTLLIIGTLVIFIIKLMYKTAVYTLVNGAITHQKPQI